MRFESLVILICKWNPCEGKRVFLSTGDKERKLDLTF
jgi:hypothetical protein